MKITELFEKAGRKVTCGCTEDSCSHCKGQHTLEEVGEKCSCCGNEIKEVAATNEMTSAGGVAAVAMPLGNMQSRNGTTTPKKKKKKKAEEGFASDAQRRAAFASGYDPKKKNKKS